MGFPSEVEEMFRIVLAVDAIKIILDGGRRGGLALQKFVKIVILLSVSQSIGVYLKLIQNLNLKKKTRFHILQGQALTISSYKFSSKREFTFIFFSLRRGDDRRVIKKSSTYIRFPC